jgi:hypothetical protein
VIKIDRIELADLGNPTALAEAVIRQLTPLKPPIPVEAIAEAVGITEIGKIETEAFEGALIAPPEKSHGVILVKHHPTPERPRFTIGHELGHYLNPWHQAPTGGFKCTSQDMRLKLDASLGARPKMEAEANEFAAELLMPKFMFVDDLKKMAEPGLEHVCDLARRYLTSQIATARRFISIHGDARALVVSKDGTVDQVYRANGFPYVNLQRGHKIHPRTLTVTFEGDLDSCSNTDATTCSAWINSELRDGAELYEQVLVQGKGYRVTLLSLDESGCDDAEDSEHFAWRPSFR